MSNSTQLGGVATASSVKGKFAHAGWLLAWAARWLRLRCGQCLLLDWLSGPWYSKTGRLLAQGGP